MVTQRWVGPVLLAAVSVACQERPVEHKLPVALLGVWETDNPKYSDRFLEFRSDRTVRFGQGESGVEVSPITGVQIDRDGEILIVRIEHLNQVGDTYTLALSYEPTRADELRFVNQPLVVWRRRAPGSPTSGR